MTRTVRSLQKSGIRAKKNRVGKRTQYWTRAKVLRRLQVSLKDFRRLCILKGIYPREAPKGKDKSKVYYHAKDIKFLSHEKLIDQIRATKVWLKRRSRLIGRHEEEDIDKLNAPLMKLDHLVRERYPTIADALRDMEDPLTLLNLFHTLRVRVHKSFNEKNAAIVARLMTEWRDYVIRTKALRKVFVSIKGYYFQANIKGQLITWLVPHQAMQKTPKSVDYTVMTTFLRFYETMVRCVNFKLFKELGMEYPPTIPTEEEASKKMLDIKDEQTTSKDKLPATAVKSIKKLIANPPSTALSGKAMKAALQTQKAVQKQQDADSDDEEEAEDKDDNAEFQQLDPSMQLTDLDAEAVQKTFEGCVVLVGRETAFEQISLVIRCGGGIALHETTVPLEYLASTKITHQVVDRPKISGERVMGRSYVQPQWVFDSFNMRLALPLAPYAPGQQLPPHLSPFVDDEKENYIPDQRNQLRAWVGLPPLKQSVLTKIRLTEEQQRQQAENADEAEYQKDLKKEQKQVKKANVADAKVKQEKPKKEQKKLPTQVSDDEDSDIDLDMGMNDGSEDEDEDGEYDEDDEEDDDVDDENFDEETFMNDSDDDEEDEDDEMDEEERKIAAKPKAVARPRENSKSERDLSKIVMNKKDKRLHSRMIYGKGRTSENAKILATKRDAAAAGVENPTLPRRNYRQNQSR